MEKSSISFPREESPSSVMSAIFLVCTLLSWLQPGEQADKPEGLARYTTTRTKHENPLVLQATLVWRRGHGWSRERKKKLSSALEENLDCDVPTWAAANDDKSHSLLPYLNRHLRNNVNIADYSRRKLSYIFKVTIIMVFHTLSHRIKLSAHGHAKYI